MHDRGYTASRGGQFYLFNYSFINSFVAYEKSCFTNHALIR
ncbi:hypothetical protein BACCOPRO_01581 [Phocaeicola coprophilus DSM 18228 = JCM 13818]|uniref:Uncharacterized protein n=1 Tax=Phocaeicola coprophilus DSM 18228 = JCM 13818 TaxID=547042 RepID=S0F6Z7_9BACT|nr:hypothetical protein BACCOPRO_01581 [Phocaeicola coprophilus DSM 18228 = JCM 13818]